MRRAQGLLVLALASLAAAACDDSTHRDIGDEINILIRRNDALVPPAIKRLAKYGRAALPQIAPTYVRSHGTQSAIPVSVRRINA